MSRAAKYTDGPYYISTWIGTADDAVKVIDSPQSSNIAHYIEVESGSTVVRDVIVTGCLPQCPTCMQFRCALSNQQAHKWESTINQLTGDNPEKVSCHLNITSNSQPTIRFQCASVKYEDVWNLGNWCNCQKNIPIEGTINIS